MSDFTLATDGSASRWRRWKCRVMWWQQGRPDPPLIVVRQGTIIVFSDDPIVLPMLADAPVLVANWGWDCALLPAGMLNGEALLETLARRYGFVVRRSDGTEVHVRPRGV